MGCHPFRPRVRRRHAAPRRMQAALWRTEARGRVDQPDGRDAQHEQQFVGGEVPGEHFTAAVLGDEEAENGWPNKPPLAEVATALKRPVVEPAGAGHSCGKTLRTMQCALSTSNPHLLPESALLQLALSILTGSSGVQVASAEHSEPAAATLELLVSSSSCSSHGAECADMEP